MAHTGSKEEQFRYFKNQMGPESKKQTCVSIMQTQNLSSNVDTKLIQQTVSWKINTKCHNRRNVSLFFLYFTMSNCFWQEFQLEKSQLKTEQRKNEFSGANLSKTNSVYSLTENKGDTVYLKLLFKEKVLREIMFMPFFLQSFSNTCPWCLCVACILYCLHLQNPETQLSSLFFFLSSFHT